MKNWSGHIYFEDQFEWKNLEKAFPELWEIIAKETKQNQDEVQYDQLALELNMDEIAKNKKPIGYIKDGARFRMVFPRDSQELIVYRGNLSEDIRDMTEAISRVLKAKKIKHSVEYDKMLLYELKRRKK